MAYSSARSDFEEVKRISKDPVVQKLAEGLIQFTRAVENDIKKIENKIRG